MKSAVLGLLLFSAGAFAQSAIPTGTVLPAQLNSSLNSKKCKPGQTVSARIMQDVPLSSRMKIRAGTKLIGHVVSLSAPTTRGLSQVTFRFDRLQSRHQSVAISTSIRALASMLTVVEADIPSTGPDRGTPWAWRTRNLIGGEVAYGEGGPVARGTQIVGEALADGVLAPIRSNPASGCRGEIAGNAQPQALWVFSSDACGVYGIDQVQITHAGRSAPVGEITLTSSQGNVNIAPGSGMLLRVNGSDQ